jgi:signal transduction histidine kinase/ActR/RegA family two-component response regulator
VRVFFGVFAIMPFVLAGGPIGAVGAAMLAMVPSIFTTGQPFAVILAGGEAAWLVLGVRYLRLNAILVGVAFWVLAGAPLVKWMYAGIAGMPPDLVWVVLASRAGTGIAAIAIGYFVLRYTGIGGKLRGVRPDDVTVREVIFSHVFALCFFALASVAVGFTYFSRRVAESDARERAFFATRDAVRQTDLFFELHQSALVGLARILERSEADAALLLEETRRAYPRFMTMLATDAAGRIVNTAPGEQLAALRGQSVADRDYFRVARDSRRPFVSGVFRGRGFGHDILVAMSVPMFARDGSFRGIVEASVQVEQLATLSATMGQQQNIQLVLADMTGRVICADEPTGLRSLQPLHTTPLAPVLHSGQTLFHFTSDRIEPDGTKRRVNNQVARCRTVGIMVIAQWAVLDVLADMKTTYALMGAILLGIAGSAVLVSRAAHRKLSRPLEEFSRHTSQQAATDEVSRIAPNHPGSPREVTDVFTKFNALAGRLNDTYAELRRHNAELDRRVAERTREAEAARLEAEAANRSKTEFLAMTSHEIRTPLNAIVGLAEVGAVNQPDSPEAARMRTIAGAGRRLLGVVNDLLDLSRVEAGKLELHVAPVELGALVEDLRALLSQRAAQSKLRLDFEIGPALPLWVEADGPRLQQVLINLIGNALKFTSKGGVTVRIDPLARDEKGVGLRFAVIDTGPGISAAEQARLFQPYVQVGDAAAGAQQGTGLGLSISRRLVALCGGELKVRSAPGQGSEFHFSITVPGIAPPPPAAAAADRGAAATLKLHVLAVDDNETNREVLRGLLESSFALLEVVATGGEAVARLRAERFDAALIDLEMPDMDGVEVACTIRGWQGAEASRGCRLIAFSAHGRAQMWERCAAAGFDEFAEKPINRRELLRAISAAPAAPASGRNPATGGTT